MAIHPWDIGTECLTDGEKERVTNIGDKIDRVLLNVWERGVSPFVFLSRKIRRSEFNFGREEKDGSFVFYFDVFDSNYAVSFRILNGVADQFRAAGWVVAVEKVEVPIGIPPSIRPGSYFQELFFKFSLSTTWKKGDPVPAKRDMSYPVCICGHSLVDHGCGTTCWGTDGLGHRCSCTEFNEKENATN